MGRYLTTLALGLAFAAVAGGCSHRKTAATEAHPPQNIDQLKKSLADVLARTHVPGVGIALVSKDKVIWVGGVGKADLASGRDVDADTMFRIGSITKGFVALSLLQLHEKGKLSLDARVADIAPEVPIVNPWEQTDPVRIANLLEHTAGFNEFPLAELYDFSGSGEVPLLKTLQVFPEPQYVRWRPGMFFSYANADYGVAGYILEKTTHQSCADYLAEDILRPIGMMHSDLRLTPEIKAVLAEGYEYNPPSPVPYFPILLRSAGDLKSSPNEMARFVRMMLNRGSLDGVRIVTSESITRMETPETSLAARKSLKNGYGLGNVADLNHPFVAHGHDGGLDGFLSSYEYLPDQGVGYFFSINDSDAGAAPQDIANLLFKYVTRGMTLPPKPAPVPLDTQIENAAGFYQFVSPRQEWTRLLVDFVSGWTFVDKGTLYRRTLFPGPRVRMLYLGGGLFRTEKEAGASGLFCKGADGDTYGCSMLASFRRVNPLWPLTRFSLIVAALLLMSTSVAFAMVWIPRKFLGRLRGVEHLSVRALPLLATLSFIALLWRWTVPPIVGASANPSTLAIFLLSIVFPLLSILALVVSARSGRFQMNRAVQIHSLLVAIACVGVSGYLGYWGLIGVRVWALS